MTNIMRMNKAATDSAAYTPFAQTFIMVKLKGAF